MNLPKNWLVITREKAKGEIKKFPQKDQAYINEALQVMSLDPYVGDIIKIKGEENTWRKRIGSYRIFFEVMLDRKIVYIFKVKPEPPALIKNFNAQALHQLYTIVDY